MSTFDFGTAEAWDVSTDSYLSPGNHVVTIVEADMGETRNDPKPQIELRIENENGSLRDWVVITPKTVGKVVQLYDAAHVQRPQAGEFDAGTGKLTDECVARLRGRKVGAVVRSEPSLKDPAKTVSKVAGYVEEAKITADAPIDTAGLGNGSPSGISDDDVPF